MAGLWHFLRLVRPRGVCADGIYFKLLQFDRRAAKFQERFSSDQTAGTRLAASATLMRSPTMNGTTPNCQDFSGPMSSASQAKPITIITTSATSMALKSLIG